MNSTLFSQKRSNIQNDGEATKKPDEIKPKLMYTLVPELNDNNQILSPNTFQNNAQNNFGYQPSGYGQNYFAPNYGQNYFPSNSSPNEYGSVQGSKPFKKKPFYQMNTVNGVQKQLCYYFSEENLIKDNFLKKQMDSNGFVNVSIIENFPRIKNAKTSRKMILKGARKSDKIELVGEYFRSKDSWWKFIGSATETKPQTTLKNSKPTDWTKDQFEQFKSEQANIKSDEEEEDQISEQPEEILTEFSNPNTYYDKVNRPLSQHFQPSYPSSHSYAPLYYNENDFYPVAAPAPHYPNFQFSGQSDGFQRSRGRPGRRGRRGRGRRGRGQRRGGGYKKPAYEPTSTRSPNSTEAKPKPEPLKEAANDSRPEKATEVAKDEVIEVAESLEKAVIAGGEKQ